MDDFQPFAGGPSCLSKNKSENMVKKNKKKVPSPHITKKKKKNKKASILAPSNQIVYAYILHPTVGGYLSLSSAGPAIQRNS